MPSSRRAQYRGRNSSSMPAPTRRWTRRKRNVPPRSRSTRRARESWPRKRSAGRGADPLFDRLCVRRQAHDAVRRGRAHASAQCLRREQARRRARHRAIRRARARVSHQLGLRRARQQFPADDPEARAASATNCASSPTRPARRTGAARCPTRRQRLVARGLAVARPNDPACITFPRGETTSWHGFAQAIVGDAPRPRVVPIATSEYPTPARRPAYGVLSTRKFEATFGYRLPDWREALAACRADASAHLPPATERCRALSIHRFASALPCHLSGRLSPSRPMTHVRFCAAMAALSLSSWGGVAHAGDAAIMSAPPAEPRTAQVESAHPVRLLLNKDAPAARIDLPPPEAAELAAFKARNAVSADRGRRVYSKALAVGFGREMPSESRTLRLSELTWVADRRRWPRRANRNPFAERRLASRRDAAAGDGSRPRRAVRRFGRRRPGVRTRSGQAPSRKTPSASANSGRRCSKATSRQSSSMPDPVRRGRRR